MAPVRGKYMAPVCAKHMAPVCAKHMAPVCAKHMAPVCAKHMAPVCAKHMAPVKQQATAAASGQGKDAECVLEQKGNVVWTKWRNGSGKCEGKPSGGPGRATGSGMLEQRHIYAHVQHACVDVACPAACCPAVLELRRNVVADAWCSAGKRWLIQGDEEDCDG
eukprot:1161815-Pelagomonas_calceolata.AAC.11